MGQRLVLTVRKNNKPVFNIYYHWSAYTESSFKEARKIVNVLKNCNTGDPKNMIRTVALHLLNANNKAMVDFLNVLYKDDPANQLTSFHGGINVDDFKVFLKDNPDLDTDDIRKMNNERNRDEGLLSFTEKGMQENETWSEGDLVIDLDDHTINSDVLCVFGSIDDYNDMADEFGMDKYEADEIPVAPEHLDCFDIDKLDTVCDFVSECGFIAKNEEGEVYEFVA